MFASVVPLTAVVVQALSDGRVFLGSGWPLLAEAYVAPRCRTCRYLGADPTIGRAWAVGAPRVDFSCAHTAGWVRLDGHQRLDLQPLLEALGWDLCCTRCGSRVVGDNAKTDANFTVVCPCLLRTMANPLAQSTDLSSVAGLGGQ